MGHRSDALGTPTAMKARRRDPRLGCTRRGAGLHLGAQRLQESEAQLRVWPGTLGLATIDGNAANESIKSRRAQVDLYTVALQVDPPGCGTPDETLTAAAWLVRIPTLRTMLAGWTPPWLRNSWH